MDYSFATMRPAYPSNPVWPATNLKRNLMTLRIQASRDNIHGFKQEQGFSGRKERCSNNLT